MIVDKQTLPTPLPDVCLSVAAGGLSRRFGVRNTLLCPLDGLPVFCHCLKSLLPLLNPAHIVLVVPQNDQQRFRDELAKAGLSADIRVVAGGGTRQQSVISGLRVLPESVTIVAVQDAARPYTSPELLKACVDSARQRGSGIAARAVTDTIKVVDPDGRIRATPPRHSLRAAETPQTFRRDLLEQGYAQVIKQGLEVTDDGQAVELLHETVYVVEHEDNNAKITFAEDLPES